MSRDKIRFCERRFGEDFEMISPGDVTGTMSQPTQDRCGFAFHFLSLSSPLSFISLLFVSLLLLSPFHYKCLLNCLMYILQCYHYLLHSLLGKRILIIRTLLRLILSHSTRARNHSNFNGDEYGG
jgi:hypothetical protein